MDYLKLFENHSQYESYVGGGGMLRPNVSHCIAENEVHYNPIPHDYSKDYLTLESLENDNTFVWESSNGSYSYTGNPISYSLDNGETWNSLSVGIIATVNSGDKILLKAINSNYKYIGYSGIILTCEIHSSHSFNVYGNILSMVYGDNFVNNNILNSELFTFAGCSIVSAENLILPSEFGENGAISSMFSNCADLVNAPELPATTLAEGCYSDMFYGCTSLTTAPQLPATTLAYYCYGKMFAGCTSLTTAPELPAITLANGCYSSMFWGCTSLQTAPELPATTLASSCYTYMFGGCTSLTSEAIVPDSIDKPISGDYCSYMYCGCPITEKSGNYDVSAYDCYDPK